MVNVENLENENVNESLNTLVIDETVKVEPKIDKHGRAYGTGRRKRSVARVWIKKGVGSITVNGKNFDKYFCDISHLRTILNTFEVAGVANEFDVVSTVNGGGYTGQSGAIRHGIARALVNFDPANMRSLLKKVGMLTRDARKVERKKPGQPKARKKEQFSKR